MVKSADIVSAMRIAELSARTREPAIRGLIRAAMRDCPNVPQQRVLDAIEEREAAAATIVARHFALPHALIDWDGDYLLALGRSRSGIDYGVRGGDRVHLIVLLIIGNRFRTRHLDLLAAVAKLFHDESLRQAIIDAGDRRQIQRILRQRVTVQQPAAEPEQRPVPPSLTSVLVNKAIQMAQAIGAQALLVALDSATTVPWRHVLPWRGRLLIVTNEPHREPISDRADTHVFEIPGNVSRWDRANLGLMLAGTAKLLNEHMSVVCLTGRPGHDLDSITVAKPHTLLSNMFTHKGHGRVAISPAVILRVVSIGLELAAQGREGNAVGALFVIGDSARVMRHAKQLVLNPFHGYPRRLRNVVDPSLVETIKEFSLIDGAFIIDGDGHVRSAGAYLVSSVVPSGLPSGLGARHQTAAAITAQTRAIAVTVSQSTGTVSVMHHGTIVLTFERTGPSEL